MGTGEGSAISDERLRVAVLAGDGIGPEVVAEARRVVDALGLPLDWSELDWGTDFYERTGGNGSQFCAVTDPGSPLVELARERADGAPDQLPDGAMVSASVAASLIAPAIPWMPPSNAVKPSSAIVMSVWSSPAPSAVSSMCSSRQASAK